MSVEVSASASSFVEASTLVRSCFSHSLGAVKQMVGRAHTNLDATVSHCLHSTMCSSSSSSSSGGGGCIVVQPSLVQACFNGDPDEVRAILYKKEDVNYQVVCGVPRSLLDAV